ncbi:MAG: hypothetical protein BGO82_20645 [Devosia sp. 67-54]|uniref:hypothetical protein n=1 Tax=unclassified Devosia TaxID=196773 RepID=UPI0009659D71|nr:MULTISPECIES: hypothetical protein [unclassified Devosia]MBN9306507.1 hypothetical protein [Devosia sp.]OJX18553.1 MAG: hypothetical protein BGO82_20645 [Devosia sp. 67-54]
MSSRKNHLVSQERITKRLLGRHNYDLLKPQKLTPKIVERGGYKVRDAATGKIVFGEQGYEFSATLEDVEAWLETLEDRLH